MNQKTIVVILLLGFLFSPNNVNSKRDEHVDSCSFYLATWNVGHFDYGVRKFPELRNLKTTELIKRYQVFLQDSISSDVLCLNEYSDGRNVFKKKNSANGMISRIYKTNKVYDKFGAICNCVASKLELKNISKNNFKSSKFSAHRIQRSEKFYYISSDLYIKGNKIKLICTHLDYLTPKLLQEQIEELIATFKDDDKVIMCGDWNTMTYHRFRKAGYTLANDGTIVTYPKKKYALDNIVVKGVKISEVRAIKTNLSDHYPLVCKITIE